MCDKSAYREQGYTPRTSEELWEASPMNPKNKKKEEIKEREWKGKTGIDFLNDYIR